MPEGGAGGAGLDGFHEAQAGVDPRGAGLAGIGRGDGQGVAEAVHELVSAEHAKELVKGRMIVVFIRGAGGLGFHAGGNRLEVVVNFLGELGCAFVLEDVFEAVIEAQGVVQLHELLFKDAAAAGFDALDAGALALQVGQAVGQLVKGIVFLVLGQFEKRQEVAVVDPEDRPGVRGLGFGHDFQEPVHGRERAAGGRNGLLGADLKQGVAGDGVEGLKPAVEQDGQASKLAAGEAVLGAGFKRGKGPGGHDEGEDPGKPLFHDCLRRAVKFTR